MSAHTKTNIDPDIEDDLQNYEEWIKKYRAREIGEIKMQKIRLQVGTYAQRQEGVQMQRIKFPGGAITSRQLHGLANTAEKYAGSFIHLTTRQDAQFYYLKLEDCPAMMRMLASVGITTREACGNTVRNITAGYRSGMDPSEPFDVTPYADALYRFLIRNKFNQVMGRKMKFAFESASTDYAGLLFHDLGFQAVIKNGKRGFKTYIGGGLGAVPMLAHLYTDFLPEEELFNLTAATLRIFDRHGERKNRMAARMKYLVKKLGWEPFKELIDAERKQVALGDAAKDFIAQIHADEKKSSQPKPMTASGLAPEGEAYRAWIRDNTCDHKAAGFRGVTVRLKLGDFLSDQARVLADLAEKYSFSKMKITTEQNLFFPWVSESALPALYEGLVKIKLAESGALTLEDAVTCPGADTCRLGITSAKGLGQSVAESMTKGLGRFKELARNVTLKVSGCPNSCAQHTVANIGFQGAAVKNDGKSVPSHELYLGGQYNFDDTRVGHRMGKFPAKNCPAVVEKLFEIYQSEKQEKESFADCMQRYGFEKIKEILAPFQAIPSFEERPDFYEDWGHANEQFATRTGIKGECAGAPIQEKAPVMSEAREKLAQAEAFFAHKEFGNSIAEAYDAFAAASRVPLYANLIDPFTAEQAIWEFENVFVRANLAGTEWLNISEKLEGAMDQMASEAKATELIALAKKFIPAAEDIYSTLKSEK